MSELWLVRHGQTPWNVDGRLTGWTDVPLTALGERQARALSGGLTAERFERVVASDLNRAVHTARLAYGEPHTVSAALRELNFGELEGLRWDEIAEHHKSALQGFEGFQAPGGESTATLRQRVFGVLDALPPGRHLIFSHGGVLRLVLREFDQDGFLPPCSVIGLDWRHKRLQFVQRGEW
ncbi:histidine phosphatase family protein [uncultured Meiothermus sp.]|jgi:probable phosphoglycerate mutase|uniref:histidine phosphatase family protein n=1 Tax=uncultured Meiothermus sp. TaxID=157471 RepID=UPI00261C6AC3|nr:histidine phosphatase family protein [uncultured Meiothermus sp.]